MRPKYILPAVLFIFLSPIVSYAELILDYGGHRDLAVYNTVTHEEAEIINKAGEGYWFGEDITRFPKLANKYIAQSSSGAYDSERKIVYTYHLWVIEIGAETKANKITQVEGAAFGLETIITPNEKLIFLSWLDRQSKRWTRVINAETFEEIKTTDEYYFDQADNFGTYRYIFDRNNIYFFDAPGDDKWIVTVDMDTAEIKSNKILTYKSHNGRKAINDIKNGRILIYEAPEDEKIFEQKEHTYSIYDLEGNRVVNKFKTNSLMDCKFAPDGKNIVALEINKIENKNKRNMYLLDSANGRIIDSIGFECAIDSRGLYLKNGKLFLGQDEIAIAKQKIIINRGNKTDNATKCLK